MGWAEKRVEEYQHGKRANWLERRALEHANPVHFPLAMAAVTGLVYGLWLHDWLAIVGASLLSLSGHIYCWTRHDASATDQPRLPDDRSSILKAN
jgi:hypothetical protein